MENDNERGPFVALGILLLMLGMLVGLAAGLSSCATEQPLLTQADSVFVASGLAAPRKIKARTVIMQGPASTANVADNRKAGQHQGSAATAPQAQASNASKRSGGPPWWVFLLVAVAGAAGWEYVSHRGLLAWLPWRARPG